MGGHRHDLHMCQISDIFKTADYRSLAQNKKIGTLEHGHIIYHLKALFMLIDNLIRTKVLKSTVKKLLVIAALVVHHRTLKQQQKKKK